jgi:ABC-type transport system involved in cytochrome c biogenesis permease subunit
MPPAFVRALASLKLTVVLLIVIAIFMSMGTILESFRGAEAARAVYYAPWFFALEGLFALNIIAALWERWPRNRQRIGFLVTHASMLLILGGALATATSSVNGRLALWEGESSRQFMRELPGGHEQAELMPFAVRLDAYEMDMYPGTQRAATYRSRITVLDGAGPGRHAVIEMNHPFAYGRFQFFQSSYNLADGRRGSVLSVSRDPGQAIVFFGYYLLILGMLVVLVTRITQFRAAEREQAARPFPVTPRALVLAIVAGALAFALAPHQALAAPLPPAGAVATLRQLPVQCDGREMPFDTQAREAVLTVTGQRRWQGADPVATAMGWTLDARHWASEPIVKIDAHIADVVGLAPGTTHASYRTLLGSEPLVSLMGPALERQAADHKPAPGDKSLLKFDERIELLHLFLSGTAIRAIPAAERPSVWGAPPLPAALETWTQLEARGRPFAPSFYPGVGAIQREIRYNAVNPPFIAWLLLLPAAIAAGLTLERDRWKLRWVVAAGTVLGFLVMTWGIAMRWQIAGRIPASNMYESMLFLGWGVGLFGVVSLLVRSRMLVYNASAMSALVMLLLDRLPMDPFIHPMAPVLAGTPWLAIHVPIIMVSYSTFAIATFLAHLVLGARLLAPGRPELTSKWSNLLYWYLLVGSILLIAGIITGSIWAASSWGRYWGWDPKEVWSLVAFLAYMAILHARSDGQLKPFGVAVTSIAAFWTILMTYLGVNFVLGSGMHAYGAGSGNLVRVMSIIAVAETAFILVAWRAGETKPPAAPDATAGA